MANLELAPRIPFGPKAPSSILNPVNVARVLQTDPMLRSAEGISILEACAARFKAEAAFLERCKNLDPEIKAERLERLRMGFTVDGLRLMFTRKVRSAVTRLGADNRQTFADVATESIVIQTAPDGETGNVSDETRVALKTDAQIRRERMRAARALLTLRAHVSTLTE